MSLPSTPNINVPICIEPTDEYKIQEISYDGQEKYIPPPSMSENLSQLISRINFDQPIDELKEELEKNEDDSEDARPEMQIPSGSSWLFDSMRAKLRVALTEICVLNDVLSIAKEKKYMIFDAVNPKQTEQRTIVGLMAKKRALQMASQVLLDGSSTLKAIAPNEPNFYDELRELRQNWRLRRVGTSIIGYFRPANANFAVIKTSPDARGPNNQAIAVKVPLPLEGSALIQVSIIKRDDIPLVDLSASANGRYYDGPRDGTWQEKLEAAQNVLYCKAIFSHLANQAFECQTVIPTTVTGNQIIVSLFPDIKMYITLVQRTPHTKRPREISEGMKKLQDEHKGVFEHSLHQMFKAYIQRRSRESLLDEIVKQAQHFIMRQQTSDTIAAFAAQVKDPPITSHWFCLNSPTSSIVRVDIVSPNYEILGRSHMMIYIGTRQLRVITRDGKNFVLGYEPDELRHLLVWQSCLHQFIASDKLSKLLGWYTLILNYSVNVTRQELSSTAFSLVICNSNCTHMIAVKSGPQFGLSVDVAQFKEPSAVSSAITNGFNGGSNDINETSLESILNVSLDGGARYKQLNKLQDLVDNFREVDWDKMQGKDFLTKLELLMAALTDL